MIKVKIKTDVIEIKGHANQNEHGTDIVCASVSTAVFMTINQLEIFGELENLDVEIKDGFTKIKIINENDIISKIISNLIYSLSDLSKQYRKYIQIEN